MDELAPGFYELPPFIDMDELAPGFYALAQSIEHG